MNEKEKLINKLCWVNDYPDSPSNVWIIGIVRGIDNDAFVVQIDDSGRFVHMRHARPVDFEREKIAVERNWKSELVHNN